MQQGYFEDGLEEEGNINNDNIEGNESVFKVPSLPPEHGGNGVKKKKLSKKGNTEFPMAADILIL